MLSPLRILLAEDDSVLAMVLKSHLEEMGHTVIGPARNGREALELFDREHPDAAILDVRMPGLDGLEVARRIAEERLIPIVLVTACSDSETIASASTLPIFHVLIKPVGAENLGPALGVARRRFEEWAEFKEEAVRLTRKLEDRKLVSQAKGLLMELRGLSEGEAYALLRRESQSRNLPMAEIARTLLDAEALLRDPTST